MRTLGLLLAVPVLALAVLPAPAMAQAAQRSAQSDCTREVQRRGYTVISTGNFEQSRDGWQLDIRARDQRGRTVDGTCFVETRTGDVSLYGFGWGGSTAPESSSSPAPRGTSATASASCRSTGARGSSSASPTRPASRARAGVRRATACG